jgi:glycosyltransferase involved in cell wall biosynthesis
MKTVVLAPEIFMSEGGIPRILRLYLKALCELCGPQDKVGLIALNDALIDSHELRRYSNDRLSAWQACNRHKIRFTRAAFRTCRGAQLIVCGHIGQLPIAWAASRMYRHLEYVLIAHGLEVWRPFSLLERVALRGARNIWCVSDFTRRELLRYCPLPEGRAVVLPNGLDPFFVANPADTASASSAATILTVSRLSGADSYKGIDHLIEAMPAIVRAVPTARLHVIGRGDDLPRLQGLAQVTKLNGVVRFLGYVTDEEIKRELRGCRLFALPSSKEGFGLVYLEAMAHGKPCLGSSEGGTPELISSDTGVLAPYGDVPALAAACAAALQRNWQPGVITARSADFSYPRFRERLAALLPSS